MNHRVPRISPRRGGAVAAVLALAAAAFLAVAGPASAVDCGQQVCLSDATMATVGETETATLSPSALSFVQSFGANVSVYWLNGNSQLILDIQDIALSDIDRGSSFVIPASLVGQPLEVDVRGESGGTLLYVLTDAFTNAVLPAMDTSATSVAVRDATSGQDDGSGTLAVTRGDVLQASTDVPVADAAAHWQWQNDTAGGWADIPGATSDTYTAGSDDVDGHLRATVYFTASGFGNSAVVTGQASGTVVAPPAPAVTAPHLSYHVVSGRGPNASGWYRTGVRVEFTATAGSAAVSTPPSLTYLSGVHAAKTVTIEASDGGTATVLVPAVKVDTVPPEVSFNQDGTIRYSDALSGVNSHKLTHKVTGSTITYTATVTDKAGNTATARTTRTTHHQVSRGTSKWVRHNGRTLYSKSVTVSGLVGRLVLAGSSNGRGRLWVDDKITISVRRQDGTVATWSHTFDVKSGGIKAHAPVSLTHLLKAGTNKVTIRVIDTAGGKVGDHGVWLVGNALYAKA